MCANQPPQHRIFMPRCGREKRPCPRQWDEHIRIVTQHRQLLAAQIALDRRTDVAKEGCKGYRMTHADQWRSSVLLRSVYSVLRTTRLQVITPVRFPCMLAQTSNLAGIDKSGKR